MSINSLAIRNPYHAEWSGDAIVRRYLKRHGRDGVYERLRLLAQNPDLGQNGSADGHPQMDEAMMSFGALWAVFWCVLLCLEWPL